MPEKIMNKPPNDGLSNLTDEAKLGVSYNKIAEYIKHGTTNCKEIDEQIEKLHKKTEHKRNPIPTFKQ